MFVCTCISFYCRVKDICKNNQIFESQWLPVASRSLYFHPVILFGKLLWESLKKWYYFYNFCRWLVGCFGPNGPLRQYFSLYRAVSQREGERKEK